MADISANCWLILHSADIEPFSKCACLLFGAELVVYSGVIIYEYG